MCLWVREGEFYMHFILLLANFFFTKSMHCLKFKKINWLYYF